MDIEGDVETCQRESLRAPGPGERAGTKKTAGSAIKSSLAADCRRKADEARAEVEALVGEGPPLIQ